MKKQTAKDRRDERRGEDRKVARVAKDRRDEREGELHRKKAGGAGRKTGDPRPGIPPTVPSRLKFNPNPLKAGGSYEFHQPGDLERPKGPSLHGHRVPQVEPVADKIDAHQGQEPN